MARNATHRCRSPTNLPSVLVSATNDFPLRSPDWFSHINLSLRNSGKLIYHLCRCELQQQQQQQELAADMLCLLC